MAEQQISTKLIAAAPTVDQINSDRITQVRFSLRP